MDEQRDSKFDAGGSNGEDAELYLLKWNSHQNHFANRFSELLDEDDISFADVTLACEGNFLQAHRLVLSVCSPFFKNLFKVNSAEKGPATIVLANVRYTDLENILHFIYRGQVNVRKEDLNNFLETGEQLQIDGLMGQHGQTKQNSPPFKRRYSEGGQVLQKTTQSQGLQQQSSLSSRPRHVAQQSQQGNYRVVGNSNRIQSVVSHSTQSQNHTDKKPRISPTTGVANVKQDMTTVVGSNSTVSRRLSTTTPTGNSSTNNGTQSQMKNEESQEMGDSNGIKILSVASINASSIPAAANNNDYEGDGNDVFEILDYDEDQDGAENEMDMSEEMLGYGDGEGGDESMFYTYHQSSPYARSTTSSQQSAGSQQARLVGTGGIATARYPSIIDGVHFDLISADERKVAAQCKLCPGDKVIRGSGLTSSNFISHLRAFHKRELEEWREKRKTETRRRLDTNSGSRISIFGPT